VTVTVSPNAPDVAGNTTTYCQGASAVALTATPLSGGTLNWFDQGGNALTSLIPSTTDAGTFNYYVSQTLNGLTGPRSLITITVNPTPEAPIEVTGLEYPTPGSVQTYTISPVSGASEYVWTLPGDWTGSSNSTSINATVGTMNGRVSAAAVIGTCTGPATSLNVGIKPAPPVLATTSQAYCQGATASALSASSAGGATLNWYAPGAQTPSSIAPVPSTTTVGVVTYLVTQVLNGVESDAVSMTVETKALPAKPTSITGLTAVSVNTDQTYSVTPVQGATYNWSIPNSWTLNAGSGTSSISANVANAGTISVYLSLNGCDGLSQTLTVGIKPPVVDVSTLAPIVYCQGETATPLIATPMNGATLKWYTVATGGTGSANAPTPSTSLAGVVTYYVSQVLNGIESDRSAISVTVNAAPSVVSAVVTQPTCSVSTGTIVVSGGVGNQFSIDGGLSYSNQLTFSGLAASATYTITQQNSNGCISLPTSVQINAPPVVPETPVISSNGGSVVCSGGSVTLSVSNAYSGFTPAYQWYKNGVAIGGATSSSYTTYATGNYYLVSTNI
jgi:hypothetical protein